MICLIYIVLVLWNSAQIDIHDLFDLYSASSLEVLRSTHDLFDLYSASSLEQCSDRHT